MIYNFKMDFKQTVQDGYNAIADRYLAERTRNSADVQLLDEFIAKLPAGQKCWMQAVVRASPLVRD